MKSPALPPALRRIYCTAGMAVAGMLPAAATPESDLVFAGYGQVEWVGGLNMEEANNGNGWRPEYEGQPAREVNLSEPHSAMGDLSGNILIADKNANAIRQIGADGRIRTLAGTGVAGNNGDGPATARWLNGPQHAYPMLDGSFYILDSGNKLIRRVDQAGQMTTVIVESDGLSRGLWVNRDGTLIYYCTNTALKRWTPALGLNPGTVMASGFSELGNIDVAANGDVYLTDRGAVTGDPTFSKVFRITPDATPASYTPVVVAGTGGSMDSGASATGLAATSVGVRGVRGIAFHPAGGFFLATHKGGDLWYVDRNGIITMALQGNDGNVSAPSALPRQLPVASGSVMSELRSVSVALNGDLLIATNDSGFILRARAPGNPQGPEVALTQAGGAVTLNWNQSAGSWFRLESTPNPTNTPWSVREVAVTPAGIVKFTDPAPTPARQFYRVKPFRAWPN